MGVKRWEGAVCLPPDNRESAMEFLGLVALGLTTLGLIVYAEFSDMN